jgi:hypothetical protein
VTDGRHASDREAGYEAHKIGIGAADRFSGVLADLLFVDAVRVDSLCSITV